MPTRRQKAFLEAGIDFFGKLTIPKIKKRLRGMKKSQLRLSSVRKRKKGP